MAAFLIALWGASRTPGSRAPSCPPAEESGPTGCKGAALARVVVLRKQGDDPETWELQGVVEACSEDACEAAWVPTGGCVRAAGASSIDLPAGSLTLMDAAFAGTPGTVLLEVRDATGRVLARAACDLASPPPLPRPFAYETEPETMRRVKVYE